MEPPEMHWTSDIEPVAKASRYLPSKYEICLSFISSNFWFRLSHSFAGTVRLELLLIHRFLLSDVQHISGRLQEYDGFSRWLLMAGLAIVWGGKKTTYMIWAVQKVRKRFYGSFWSSLDKHLSKEDSETSVEVHPQDVFEQTKSSYIIFFFLPPSYSHPDSNSHHIWKSRIFLASNREMWLSRKRKLRISGPGGGSLKKVKKLLHSRFSSGIQQFF